MFSNFITGQTIEETVDYINDGIKNYSSVDFGREARENKALLQIGTRRLSANLNFYKFYDIWKVNPKGKLTIQRVRETYFIPSGTDYPLWLSITPQKIEAVETLGIQEVYLKSLINYFETIDRYNNGVYNYTDLYLGCKTVGCITNKPNKDRPDVVISISIEGKDNAKRISNALKHLIETANNESKFLEKDPFSDR